MLINVALPGATEITQMDDSLLVKSEGTHENENEVVNWVEYRLNDDLVHRSAHVHLKQVPAELIQAVFG